jgi:hypothetical protein
MLVYSNTMLDIYNFFSKCFLLIFVNDNDFTVVRLGL